MSDLTVVATQVRPLIPSLVVKGEAGAAMSLGDVVILNASEVWVKGDSDSAALSKGLIGVIVAGGLGTDDGTVASGEEISVLVHGRVAGFSGLNGGTGYFLSANAGKIADSAGTVSRFLGNAETTEVLFLDPVGEATSA